MALMIMTVAGLLLTVVHGQSNLKYMPLVAKQFSILLQQSTFPCSYMQQSRISFVPIIKILSSLQKFIIILVLRM